MHIHVSMGFPYGSDGKQSTCNAGNLGLIPGLGRSPGEGKGYPLQYCGLENSMDYIVHGVANNHTQLSEFHILPQSPLPSGLSHNTEQSSLCYTEVLVGYFKYSSMYLSIPNSLIILSPGNGQVDTLKATVGKEELVQQSLLGVPAPLGFWHETTF